MNLVVISGLSGSGKSIALQTLEDLEYYCVDNLPVGLLPALAEQLSDAGTLPRGGRTAVSIDARNLPADLARFPEILAAVKARGLGCQIIFLDAENPVLLKRFSETRRRHPLSRGDLPLREAIDRERELLGSIASLADLRVDTSALNIYQLRDIIRERVAGKRMGELSLLFQSFGYKRGIPTDTDIVFDVRCLPNPYWEPSLRRLTGEDVEVIAFLEAHPEVNAMYNQIRDFLEYWIPAFETNNRSYLTVSIGCTGGHHRSVYLVSRLSRHFRGLRDNVQTRHRELS